MSTSSRAELPPILARPHAWARRQSWLARFTLMNRLLLAMAFLPTGLVKATGQRFTILPIETPVGFFFEAMYQTGPYWRFIGISQMAAAVLLLVGDTGPARALARLPTMLAAAAAAQAAQALKTAAVAAAVAVVPSAAASLRTPRISSAAAVAIPASSSCRKQL